MLKKSKSKSKDSFLIKLEKIEKQYYNKQKSNKQKSNKQKSNKQKSKKLDINKKNIYNKTTIAFENYKKGAHQIKKETKKRLNQFN